MWGGVTNAAELRAIADVVDKFEIPMVKVTGGQRIDIFGIKKEDLPAVWADLNNAGMVSGHAYGKALRTVKTCVGSEWCRFGTQDSTGLGVKIERMTWGSWMPHKFKIAMAIFAGTMLLALSSKIPVPIALMTGVAGMLVAGVIHIDEAYAAINWKTIFLMACLIPLGWAMDSSGAAAWIAGHTLERLPTWMPLWLLQLLIGLLTTLFSLVISHVGATIVMVPIAINVALATGGNPTIFALTVALSASNNLMTSSNPVISMITGPANYTGRDLWRVGGAFSLICLLVIVLMTNLLF
jgi:di/tricarboxylate transporter